MLYKNSLLTQNFVLFILLFSWTTTSRANSRDSIYLKKENKVVYYNSDTIFSSYCEKGFSAVISDLYEYYEDIFWNLPEDRRLNEINKMKSIAKMLNNNNFEQEIELIETLNLPHDNPNEIQYKLRRLQKIIDTTKGHNIPVYLRSMEAMFDLHWSITEYAKAFGKIHLIDKALENVTDEEFPDKGHLYFRIGETYYFFRDYDNAIPYLRKAMRPARFYCDRAYLQAANILGNYYNLQGKIDSAEYYFRLAYNSYETVKSRPTYDAVALGNIGHSLVMRKQYDNAIPYFEAALDRMMIDVDYKKASGLTIGLAHCYFGKGEMRATRRMIDSSLVYIERSNNQDIYRLLYPLMSKYYSRIGKKYLAEAYLDSAIVANNRYMETYSSHHILKAEQELFETETKIKDEEIRFQTEKYRERFLYTFITLVFTFLGFIIFIILYRKNRNAYRALVQKNQVWAGAKLTELFESEAEDTSNNEENIILMESVDSEPNEDDLRLMEQVSELIKKDEIFKDVDLTLDSLSRQMNINRNYLSKAINKTTGKNFNTYINEYRIKEAIKIMSDKKSDVISIDAIALEVGFGNRTSFYQSFKKITGLSPSDFRNNKMNT